MAHIDLDGDETLAVATGNALECLVVTEDQMLSVNRDCSICTQRRNTIVKIDGVALAYLIEMNQ